MYNENTMKILFRFSQIPTTVYTTEWKKLKEFTCIHEEPEKFEAERLKEAKEGIAEKNFLFLPYDALVPIGLCACRGEEELFILGPFSYGRTDAFECRYFIRKNKIRECPKCQMDAFQKNHTYRDELILYDHIKEGDAEYLEKQAFYETPSHPVIINDLKKNEEYMAVIGISMAARAAIEGGLSSAEGFINNDIYLKKLSECRTVLEMDRLRRESQIHFARLVADHKKKSSMNFYVEEVKKNILSKRFAKISIQEIAEELGISKEYMQKLFKKYEGIPITEYISEIKIGAACKLLLYSGRKIQDIAECLHYGSASHFSIAFRKKMHQSPKEYRERNRKTTF